MYLTYNVEYLYGYWFTNIYITLKPRLKTFRVVLLYVQVDIVCFLDDNILYNHDFLRGCLLTRYFTISDKYRREKTEIKFTKNHRMDNRCFAIQI